MHRCSGHCCKAFRLSLPVEQLWQSRNAERQFVADMVVPLGRFASGERLPDGEDARESGDYFTCRHFDEETGDCLVYNVRPQMCRDLGVTVQCNKKGCTLRECE